jgi:hypothetical protein
MSSKSRCSSRTLMARKREFGRAANRAFVRWFRSLSEADEEARRARRERLGFDRRAAVDFAAILAGGMIVIVRKPLSARGSSSFETPPAPPHEEGPFAWLLSLPCA